MGPVGPFAGPTGYFQPIWDTFWLALDHIWDIFGLANGPNWSALMSSVLFQPCSNQFYKNYGIRPIMSYLDQRANFCTILLGKKTQHCLARCPWCGLPTQNMPSGPICVAKRLFSAYLGHFMGPLGPYLGHSWSGKWAKLVNLNVVSVVPTLF